MRLEPKWLRTAFLGFEAGKESAVKHAEAKQKQKPKLNLLELKKRVKNIKAVVGVKVEAKKAEVEAKKAEAEGLKSAP